MTDQKSERIMNRIFGVISLELSALAFFAGLTAVASKNLKMGLFYLLILIVAPVVIVYSFCTKCPCAEKGCGHILPGMLAEKLGKRPGDYTAVDLAAMMASLGALVIFPQAWLIKSGKMMLLFWMLLLTTLFQIRLFVCRSCRNEKCPGYPG